MGGVGKVKTRVKTMTIGKRKLSADKPVFDKASAWKKIQEKLNGAKP